MLKVMVKLETSYFFATQAHSHPPHPVDTHKNPKEPL